MSRIQANEESIFEIARRIDSPEVRSDYIDQACAGDSDLKRRVVGLLDIYQAQESFLESPAVAPTIGQPVTEKAGDVIGNYKLLQKIGEGGFGVVYMAEQSKPVRRKVAVKVIKPGMDTKEVVARFEAERQALAMMDHPNIARVLDAGETESGRPYFVMELVRGIPITEYCDAEHLKTRARLDLFSCVCQAVQHAHQKGVIHRDIKPSNVLVTEHDGIPVPKVIDFGVAKAINQQLTERTIFTQFQQMIGTPLYMSPEQAALSGLDIDTRSDIYSLGVLLYELLTGTTPFDKQRFNQAAYEEIRRIIREEDPPKPSTRVSTLGELSAKVMGAQKTDVKKMKHAMRGELDWIVMKALEKERSRRYDTAKGFANDIQRYLSGDTVLACPPSKTYQLRKFVRRYRGPVTAIASICFLLLAATLISTIAWRSTLEANKRVTGALRIADSKSVEAQRAQQRAEAARLIEIEKTEQLDDLLILSKARRFAAQAQTVADPAAGLLLTAAAVDTTRQAGKGVLNECYETLANIVTTAGGYPLPERGWNGEISISPDGHWMATSGWGKVGIWKLESDKKVLQFCEIKRPDVQMNACIHPEGRWLLVTSQGSASYFDLWATDIIASERKILANAVGIYSGRFSRRGKWAVVGNRHSGATKGWMLDTSRWGEDDANSRVKQLDANIHASRFQISDNDRWLAFRSLTTPNKVELWDLAASDSPTRSSSLDCQQGDIRAMRFTPEGDALLTAGKDGTVIQWSISNEGDLVQRSVVAQFQKSVVSTALGISPDGRWVASGSQSGELILCDLLKDNSLVERAATFGDHQREIIFVKFSPDSRWLLTTSLDSKQRVWKLSTNNSIELGFESAGRSEGFQFSSDSRFLAYGSEKLVQVWDLNTPTPERYVLRGHGGEVDSLAFFPGTSWLASGNSRLGSGDKSIRLWDLNNRSENGSQYVKTNTRSLLHFCQENRQAPAPPTNGASNGRYLVSTDQSNNVSIWDIESSSPFKPITVIPHTGQPLYSATLDPGCNWLLANSGDDLYKWDLQKPQATAESWRLTGLESVSEFAVSRGAQRSSPLGVTLDGSHAITRNGYFWNLQPATSELEAELVSQSGTWDVAASTDGRWLATIGMAEGELWGLSGNLDLDPRRPLAYPSRIWAVDISPDSRWLSLGGYNGGVHLYDLASKMESARILETGPAIHLLASSRDSRWLVAGSFWGTIHRWDLDAEDPNSARLVLNHAPAGPPDNATAARRGNYRSIEAIAISKNGMWIAAAYRHDRTIRVWDTSKSPSTHIVLRGHEGDIDGLTISSDGKWLASVSNIDQTMRFWQLDLDSLLAEAKSIAGRELTEAERNTYGLDDFEQLF